MVARAPSSYFQSGYQGRSNSRDAINNGHYAIAHANPAYFQPGYIGSKLYPVQHGRKGGGRRSASKKHGGTGGAHGGFHGSPLPSYHDPFGHRAQGQTRGR